MQSGRKYDTDIHKSTFHCKYHARMCFNEEMTYISNHIIRNTDGEINIIFLLSLSVFYRLQDVLRLNE